MTRRGTTLASIEAAHRLKAVSKVVIRKGSESLAKKRPKSVTKLP